MSTVNTTTAPASSHAVTSSTTTATARAPPPTPDGVRRRLAPVVVVPPGLAVYVRGAGLRYNVSGFEESALSQPTPLRPLPPTHSRSELPSTHFGDDLQEHSNHASATSSTMQANISSSSPFSHTLDARFRYTLRESEIVQMIERGDTVVIGLDCESAGGLRRLVWSGAPPSHRAECWRLLLDHSPAANRGEMRDALLQRKRNEYHGFVQRYYLRGEAGTATTTAVSSSSSSEGVPHPSHPQQQHQRGPQEKQILHQLDLDLPRHKLSLFHDPRMVERLRRMLFLWSLRHPAVGFVQGIDDIMVQFVHVFLGDAFEHRYLQHVVAEHNKEAVRREQYMAAIRSHLAKGGGGGGSEMVNHVNVSSDRETSRTLFGGSSASGDIATSSELSTTTPTTTASTTTDDDLQRLPLPRTKEPLRVLHQLSWSSVFSNDDTLYTAMIDALPEAVLDAVEADAYWCGGRMLSWVQENFVNRQPGLVRMMDDFAALVRRVDPILHDFIVVENGVPLGQACFQWFHCLLTRELPGRLSLRLWDTYLAIGPAGFRTFHVYVCVALLLDVRQQLLDPPVLFDVIMTTLKDPKPQETWKTLTMEWMDALVATAYVLSVKHP